MRKMTNFTRRDHRLALYFAKWVAAAEPRKQDFMRFANRYAGGLGIPGHDPHLQRIFSRLHAQAMQADRISIEGDRLISKGTGEEIKRKRAERELHTGKIIDLMGEFSALHPRGSSPRIGVISGMTQALFSADTPASARALQNN
jgi:hypothetical protein